MSAEQIPSVAQIAFSEERYRAVKLLVGEKPDISVTDLKRALLVDKIPESQLLIARIALRMVIVDLGDKVDKKTVELLDKVYDLGIEKVDEQKGL